MIDLSDYTLNQPPKSSVEQRTRYIDRCWPVMRIYEERTLCHIDDIPNLYRNPKLSRVR